MNRIYLLAAVALVIAFSNCFPVGAQSNLPHSHQPIEIESAPIINRIPLEARKVRRVIEQTDGSLLVTEWETGSLIQLTPNQPPERIAVGLNQPSGVVSSGTGEYFPHIIRCRHAGIGFSRPIERHG